MRLHRLGIVRYTVSYRHDNECQGQFRPGDSRKDNVCLCLLVLLGRYQVVGVVGLHFNAGGSIRVRILGCFYLGIRHGVYEVA